MYIKIELVNNNVEYKYLCDTYTVGDHWLKLYNDGALTNAIVTRHIIKITVIK